MLTFELNSSLIQGNHFEANKLLEAGAKPDNDTLLCALFSYRYNGFSLEFKGVKYCTFVELLLNADFGLDITSVKEHLLHAAQPLYIHRLIDASLPDNYRVGTKNALAYAETNLSHLSRYGNFESLVRAVARHVMQTKENQTIQLFAKYQETSCKDITAENFINWIKEYHSEFLETAERLAKSLTKTGNDPYCEAEKRLEARIREEQKKSHQVLSLFFSNSKQTDKPGEGWNIPEIEFPDESMGSDSIDFLDNG